MSTASPIQGSCHCGSVAFTLHWPAKKIGVRECRCSFCRKHGGAWTSHRDASLEIRLKDHSNDGVSRYRFGTGTAEFYVCAECGVAPFVLSEIDGNVYAVVNVNTFDDADAFTFSRSTTDFDGEATGNRLERRKRNWISSVTFVQSDAGYMPE